MSRLSSDICRRAFREASNAQVWHSAFGALIDITRNTKHDVAHSRLSRLRRGSRGILLRDHRDQKGKKRGLPHFATGVLLSSSSSCRPRSISGHASTMGRRRRRRRRGSPFECPLLLPPSRPFSLRVQFIRRMGQRFLSERDGETIRLAIAHYGAAGDFSALS